MFLVSWGPGAAEASPSAPCLYSIAGAPTCELQEFVAVGGVALLHASLRVWCGFVVCWRAARAWNVYVVHERAGGVEVVDVKVTCVSVVSVCHHAFSFADTGPSRPQVTMACTLSRSRS